MRNNLTKKNIMVFLIIFIFLFSVNYVLASAKCPLDPGEEIDPNIFTQYEGYQINFCCAGCITEFNDDLSGAEKLNIAEDVGVAIPPEDTVTTDSTHESGHARHGGQEEPSAPAPVPAAGEVTAGEAASTLSPITSATTEENMWKSNERLRQIYTDEAAFLRDLGFTSSGAPIGTGGPGTDGTAPPFVAGGNTYFTASGGRIVIMPGNLGGQAISAAQSQIDSIPKQVISSFPSGVALTVITDAQGNEVVVPYNQRNDPDAPTWTKATGIATVTTPAKKDKDGKITAPKIVTTSKLITRVDSEGEPITKTVEGEEESIQDLRPVKTQGGGVVVTYNYQEENSKRKSEYTVVEAGISTTYDLASGVPTALTINGKTAQINPETGEITGDPDVIKELEDQISEWDTANRFAIWFYAEDMFGGIGYLTNKLIGEDNLKEWRENVVEKVFCNQILGWFSAECYEVTMCEHQFDKTKGSVAYTINPDDIVEVAAHVEGSRSSPINLSDGTIEYFYKFTFYVRAVEEEVHFNVKFYDDKDKELLKLYNDPVMLKKGQTSSAVKNEAIFNYSTTVYKEICLEFSKGDISNICNIIVESDYSRENTENAQDRSPSSNQGQTSDDSYEDSQNQVPNSI